MKTLAIFTGLLTVVCVGLSLHCANKGDAGFAAYWAGIAVINFISATNAVRRGEA